MRLADLHLQSGDTQEAMAICTISGGNPGEMTELYLKLAEIAAIRRAYPDSLDYCLKARQLLPATHSAEVLLAIYCHAAGDTAHAKVLLRDARTESPDHPMPLLVVGQLAREAEQWAHARDCLATAAALPLPENWPASHKQRFLVLLHSERYLLAQQTHDDALAREAFRSGSSAIRRTANCRNCAMNCQEANRRNHRRGNHNRGSTP